MKKIIIITALFLMMFSVTAMGKYTRPYVSDCGFATGGGVCDSLMEDESHGQKIHH